MPKRTNEWQQIIEMLRKMLAGPRVTVTPSKLLRDAVTGVEREVDVVVEHDVDSDIFTQSFEITSKSRPADLQWAEQLIKKHETLPTDRLYLVSWSGFTGAAYRLAQTNPRVRPVTPKVVESPGGQEFKTLYADTVQLTTRTVVCLTRQPSGGVLRVPVGTDHQVFSAEKAPIGVVQMLVASLMADPGAIERVMRDVHFHPKRDELSGFTLGVKFQDPAIYLLRLDTDQLDAIVGLEVCGEIVFSQEPVDLQIRDFEAQRFAHGRAKGLGTSGLLVAALGPASEITNIATTLPTFPSRQGGRTPG